jgi:iron complex outermembrane receptor protein
LFRRFDNRPSVNADSYAGYGQVDWQFSDELKFTGGLRYSYDRKYGTESVRLICFSTRACLGGTAVGPNGPNNPFTYPDVLGGATPAIDLTQVPSVVDSGLFGLPRGVTGPTTYDGLTGFASRHYASSWGALTGTAGVEWTPDEDTLVYGKYSRGYKSGGFNIGIFTALSFQPWTAAEHVDSFEIGAKKTFGDWLTANIALFHYHYTDLQIPLAVVQSGGGLTQSATTFFNVPSSISQGVELETVVSPVENLQLMFNYSYLDAHITRGSAADPADPNGTAAGASPLYTDAQCAASYGPGIGDTLAPLPGALCTRDVYTVGTAPGGVGWNKPQNLAGNRLPNSPKNKVAVNVLYSIDTDIGIFQPSVSYVWRDVQYGTLFTRSYNAAPSWDQWDARVRYTSEDDKYEVIFYGKNIFNKIGYDNGAYGTRLAGTVNVPSAACAPSPVCEVNFVQGVNGPAGYGAVRGATNGVVSTYSVTPPALWGIELHYKFD